MGAARLTEKDSPHHCNTDEVIGTLVCPTGNYDILRRMVTLRNKLKSLWLFLKGVCVCLCGCTHVHAILKSLPGEGQESKNRTLQAG